MLDVAKAGHRRERMDETIQYPQIVVCDLQNALSLCFERVEVLLQFFG